MINKKTGRAIILAGAAIFAPISVYADIVIKVGFAVGGGYDANARLMANHLGRFLPEAGSIYVENVDGAGSLRLAKMMLAKEPADGTVIGSISSWFPVGATFDPALVGLDFSQLSWIGGIGTTQERLCAVSSSLGIADISDFAAQTFQLGATTSGTTDVITRLVQNTLHADFEIVRGFSGTAPVRAAIIRGELDGYCSLRIRDLEKVFEPGTMTPILQASYRPNVDLPYPLLRDLVEAPEDIEIVDFILSHELFQYSFALPPGTPEDILTVYRQAFDAMVQDPEFLAEAAKLRMQPSPITGAELEDHLDRIQKTPLEVLARAGAMLD